MKRILRSKINQRIFQSLKKLGAMFLILIFSVGVYFMQGTNAGFLDEEKSEGNVFSAATLDFYLAESADFSPKITPSKEVTRSISIFQDGSLDFNYKVYPQSLSGDLCDHIQIKDNLDDTYQDLVSYVSSEVTNSTKTNWTFTAEMTSNNSDLADEACEFDLVFEAWQEGKSYGTGGFVDVEIVSSEIESDSWTSIADHLVINEVYYDVASDKGAEGDNEWVEIYNPTSSAVNLRGWELCDNTGCDEIASVDLDIPANGYAVITDSATTWDEWTVPGSAVKIALGENVGGGGLSNTDDRLILKDDDGAEIDAMSYGSDASELDPACPDVAEGHSLARKPAGQDSDINSDFEDLSSPNPGTNPHTVVMNEIMPNPIGDDDADMPKGEWVELYNYGEYNIDLSDWRLENGDGDNLSITKNNTDTGNTIIKAGEKMVVYRNGSDSFELDNEGDAISLVDENDLIKDSHKFEEVPEGKSLARFPDITGPWIDPESTPGEDNRMNEAEKTDQILMAYGKCFEGDKLDEENRYESICQVEYLKYLGLLDDLDDKKVSSDVIEKIKELKAVVEENEEGDEEGAGKEEDENEIKEDEAGAEGEEVLVSEPMSAPMSELIDDVNEELNVEEEISEDEPEEVAEDGEAETPEAVDEEAGVEVAKEDEEIKEAEESETVDDEEEAKEEESDEDIEEEKAKEDRDDE